MAVSGRIHGGFMADSWRMGLQKLITVLDRFHTYKGGSIGAVTYEAKKERQNLLRNLHRRKKNFFLFMM
jgi:hypothetical protein